MINHNLTQREQEVLKLVAQAKTNKEIREELYIADCTLDTHLHNIYKKLGLFATDRCQTSVLRLKTAMYVWNAKQQANKEYYNQKIKKLLTENKQLKKSIDRIMQNKEIKTIDSEISLLNAELQQQNKRLIARLRPLEDSYFNGLSSIEIAELAKKSIRITAENRNLVNWLNRIIYCFTFSARIPSNLIADLKKYLEEIGKLEV